MNIRFTQSVKGLLILSFVGFLLQQSADQFFGLHWMGQFALIPALFFGEHRYWQLLTYSFMHHDVAQLFFDLLMIAFIGAELEMIWGAKRFLQYYFLCAASSAVIHLLIYAASGVSVPLLGASGAIYGLLVAYGLMFGERVLLFMMIFPMKAKHFVWVLVLIELMTTIYSGGPGGRGALTSVAHLGGMVCGFFYLWARAIYTRRARQSSQERLRGRSGPKKSWFKGKKKAPGYLRLVVDNEFGEEDPSDKGAQTPKTWH